MDQNTNKSKDSKKFDHTIFTEYLHSKFIEMIIETKGKQILYYEECLEGPLSLINITTQILLDNGVEKNGIYLKENDDQDESQRNVESNFKISSPLKNYDHVIFFCSPKVGLMNKIKEIVLSSEKKEYTIIFWPRRSIFCSQKIEDHNIYANVNIKDFNFDLIPLESDLLSLEMDFLFKDCYIQSGYSLYQQVAESIQRLQVMYGKISNIYGKGRGAEQVIEILRDEQEQSNFSFDESKMDCAGILILDRNIDWITALCSQVTYEGVIDDEFNIKHNTITIDNNILGKKDPQGKSLLQGNIKVTMNNSIKIFQKTRDILFHHARTYLNKQALDIQGFRQEKMQNNIIKEMTQIVKDIKEMKNEYPNLNDHVNISYYLDNQMKSVRFRLNIQLEQQIFCAYEKPEVALTQIDNMISVEEPIHKIFRFLCLISLCENGISEKYLNQIKKDILQTYGFQHMLSFKNLEKMGMLKKQTQKSDWSQVKNNFKLINDQMDDIEAKDLSYFYAGLVPLIPRLVEYSLDKNGWKTHLNNIDRLIPGKTIYTEHQNKDFQHVDHNQFIIIFIIGGITRAEISAIRFLAASRNKEIIICTTQIINSNKIIRMLQQKIN